MAFRLEPVSLRNPLPIDAQAPIVSATLADRLYAFARDPGSGRVSGCTLDSQAAAQPSGELSLLTVSDAAACQDVLIVAGASGSGSPGAVAMAADGGQRWTAEASPGGELAAWPAAACRRDAAHVAWATKPASLHLARVDGGSARALNAVDVEGSIKALAAIGVGDGVGIAVATDRALRWITVANAGPAKQVGISATPATAPNISRMNSGVLVSWLRPPGVVMGRRLAGDLTPGAAEEVILTASSGQTILSFRALGTHRGALALTWTVTEGGRPGEITVTQFVGLYDLARQQLAAVEDLGPGSAYLGGGWLGDVLLVIHGSDSPLASALRSATDANPA
jgi:hypothetical protein